jgi:hypothetical protein
MKTIKINFMKPKIVFVFFLFSSALFVACGPSTKIEKTWTDPSFKSGSESFHKILAMGLLKDESTRRIAEDKIVAAIKGATAVQSYTYLQASDTVRSAIEEKLKKDGFDGVVIMHLSTIDKSTSYVPGTTYGGWYGYRYGYYGYGGSPGYYQEDKTYYVETNIYSLTSNKLLWSGTTSSLNPSKLDNTLDDIINTLRAELKKQGLVK